MRGPEDHYQTLVELSPDGVISLNGDAQIISINREACRLLGCLPWEIKGQPARDWLSSGADGAATPWLESAARDGTAETEFELQRHDGKIVLVWAKAVSHGGGDAGSRRTAVYLRDIAQRRKLDMLRDDLVGLIAHEIRSPLTVIRGAVNTVLGEWQQLPPEEIHQLLEDAALEAESLANVTANLLELSRVQANRLLLQVEPVSIQAVARDIVSQVSRQTDRHRFRLDVPDDLPPVHADQLRLERVMYNLVENAVKYSPRGGEVGIAAWTEAGNLTVSVTDHGIGLSPSDRERLFAPFQRIDGPSSADTSGLGLGLLVCRRLIEVHGGRIWVESEPGQGCTFLFTLPLHSPTSPAGGASEAPNVTTP